MSKQGTAGNSKHNFNDPYEIWNN